MSLAGVDLSQWQGEPGSWRGEAGAIQWAGIKATELGANGSRYVSPTLADDAAYLRQHNLGRIFYLFGHPASSPVATVALMVAEVTALGLDDGDGVALDLEVNDGLDAAHVSAWSRDVMAGLERELHRKPVCYTFLSFAYAGNCEGLGGYPLWIADPSSPAGHPRVPPPWIDWTIHQWGQAGIDRDLAAYPTLQAMRLALGRRGTVPPSGGNVLEHITAGDMTLAELAHQYHTDPSTILRLTAEHGPSAEFSPGVARLVNDVFLGTVAVTTRMPAGLRLFLPEPHAIPAASQEGP
jgi:hypothetical protein